MRVLTSAQFGCALARYAFERSEMKLAWIKQLSTNIAGYKKRSLAWLVAHAEPRLFP
jgi:hypothetical protein